VTPIPANATPDGAAALSGYSNPRNNLSSSTGTVIATQDPTQVSSNQAATTTTNAQPGASSALPFDEEAKLVYGVVLSLRNMVKKLSGR